MFVLTPVASTFTIGEDELSVVCAPVEGSVVILTIEGAFSVLEAVVAGAETFAFSETSV